MCMILESKDMIYSVHQQNFLNVKLKLKRKYKDKFKNFMHELLLQNQVKEIFKFQNYFKQWMAKMKEK